MPMSDFPNVQNITINGDAFYPALTNTYYPAMVYPFVVRCNGPKTLQMRFNRNYAGGSVYIGHPVVLKGACSWFITS